MRHFPWLALGILVVAGGLAAEAPKMDSKTRQSTEVLKLDGWQKAHRFVYWYNNRTGEPVPQSAPRALVRYDAENLYFHLADGASGGGWEIHIAEYNDRGNLTIVRVDGNDKVQTLDQARRRGGMPTGTPQPATENIAVVKRIEDGKALEVAVPIRRIFPKQPGKVAFFNLFHIVPGEPPAILAWNPTFDDDRRTLPWRLGRGVILE